MWIKVIHIFLCEFILSNLKIKESVAGFNKPATDGERNNSKK